MTMKLVCAMLAVLAGAAAAFQSASNSGLSSKVGLPAALVVNTSIVMLGVLAFFVAAGPHGKFFPAGTSWTLYLGGFCGFVIIAAMAWVFPRMGGAFAVSLMVVGQGVAALLIDHFGLMGVPVQPVTLARAGGLVLVVGGIALLRA